PRQPVGRILPLLVSKCHHILANFLFRYCSEWFYWSSNRLKQSRHLRAVCIPSAFFVQEISDALLTHNHTFGCYHTSIGTNYSSIRFLLKWYCHTHPKQFRDSYRVRVTQPLYDL